MNNHSDQKLLVVEHLSKEFQAVRRLFDRPQPSVKAVNDVSFHLMHGETFGIVGESGCGKTTVGKCIVRLYQPTEGKLLFDDGEGMKDLLKLNKKDGFEIRQKLQIVFQDPYASLNPTHTILEAFDEPMRIHQIGGRSHQARKELIAKALEDVNLQPDYMHRYPHEFSGGQRQRICIAKALVLKPRLIVCDEPVSALDVSIQAQILNLMKKLQKDYQLSYLFIAHDLSVVQYMSDRIAVMYLGNIVEMADADELYSNHLHPYTDALLSAVPTPVYGAKKDRIVLTGDVPSPMNPPSGCPFHPRCRQCMEKCKAEKPALHSINNSNHSVACHLFESGDSTAQALDQ